jgi:hypothetical protein
MMKEIVLSAIVHEFTLIVTRYMKETVLSIVMKVIGTWLPEFLASLYLYNK